MGITDDCVLEELIMELTRGVETLNLVLSGTRDLVQDVDVVALTWDSDHNAVKFNI